MLKSFYSRTFVAAAVFLYSHLAWAIHGGQDLKQLSLQPKDPMNWVYKRLLSTTGNLASIDDEPIVETPTELSFTSFNQSNCSVAYFRKPAFFVVAAHCLAGSDGKVDSSRRWSKVFVEGKAFTVEPTSVVIHENYLKGPSKNDLAVFSIRPAEAIEFAKTHEPIPVIPTEAGSADGDLTLFVGYGARSKKGEEFGFPIIKEFDQLQPTSADLVGDSEGNLRVGIDEKVLTFATRDGRPGVNCVGDSGAGGYVLLNRTVDKSPELFLKSIFLGKVGPGGDKAATCESVSRYATGADLRYYRAWLEQATIESHKQGEAGSQVAEQYRAWRKVLYGNKDPYDNWVYTVLPEKIQKLRDTHANLTSHEFNKVLYAFMQAERKRREARDLLTANSSIKRSIPNTKTVVMLPADPFEPGGNWARFDRGIDQSDMEGAPYINPNPMKLLSQFSVRNTGDTPLTFSALWARNVNGIWVKCDLPNGNGTLAPGQSNVYTIDQENFARYAEIRLVPSPPLGAAFRVDGLPASAKQIADKKAREERKILAAAKEAARLAELQRREEARKAEEERKERQRQFARERDSDFDRIFYGYQRDYKAREQENAWWEARKNSINVHRWNNWVDDYTRRINAASSQYNRDVAEHNRKYGDNQPLMDATPKQVIQPQQTQTYQIQGYGSVYVITIQ